MKTIILSIMLGIICASASAQTPINTDSLISEKVSQAGRNGVAGLFLTTFAPIWIVPAAGNPSALQQFIIVAGVQAIIGTIIQITAWHRLKEAGDLMHLRATGKYREDQKK